MVNDSRQHTGRIIIAYLLVQSYHKGNRMECFAKFLQEYYIHRFVHKDRGILAFTVVYCWK